MKKLRIMLWKWIEGPAGRVPTVRRWLDRVVLPLAILTLTAPLAAQTDPCRNQSQTRTTSVQRNQITETRDSVVGVYVTRDSVRWRCVLRVATAPPPPVDTTPTPPPPVDTTTPPPSPGGPFAPPDLVNLNFNNPADDFRINNGGADLVAYQSWDATGGRNGSRALRVTVSSQFNNGFGPIGPIWPNRGRVFVRIYFRMQGTPGGNVKGYRFHADFSNLGEVYGGSPCWSFDWEPSGWAGACVYAGMDYGAASGNSTCSNLADGAWHWYEIDYNRNAGANVEVRLWCDGKAVVMPDGLSARYFGQDIPAVWHGGSRTTNTPSTLRAARVDRNYLTGIYLWPTISQASGTATIWVDDVAASSQRIGP